MCTLLLALHHALVAIIAIKLLSSLSTMVLPNDFEFYLKTPTLRP